LCCDLISSECSWAVLQLLVWESSPSSSSLNPNVKFELGVLVVCASAIEFKSLTGSSDFSIGIFSFGLLADLRNFADCSSSSSSDVVVEFEAEDEADEDDDDEDDDEDDDDDDDDESLSLSSSSDEDEDDDDDEDSDERRVLLSATTFVSLFFSDADVTPVLFSVFANIAEILSNWFSLSLTNFFLLLGKSGLIRDINGFNCIS
jgi:hypothetical protein